MSGAAALGILPKDRPAARAVAFRESAFSENPGFCSFVDTQTGEINHYEPGSDDRVKKYVRQSAARRILGKEHRTGWCLRRVAENQRCTILKNNESGKAHYAGLMSCGRVWSCPVCASKISQRRRQEVSSALSLHRIDGGALLFVTFTFPHTRHDDLAELMVKQKKAWNALKASREFKDIRAAHGLTGTIRAQEITHGSNGWHPHIHEIWFMESRYNGLSMANPATKIAIETRLYDVWLKQCIKHGLGEPSKDHGVDVQDGTFADKYISKWGIEDELTKANLKNGKKKSRTPFQLLDYYIDGDKQSGALFAEYVQVFKSMRQLCWSKGLKKRFQITEKTDESIAAEQESNSDILGHLELEQWKTVLRFRGAKRDARAELLHHAELGGWSAVLEYVAFLNLPEFEHKPLVHLPLSNPG